MGCLSTFSSFFGSSSISLCKVDWKLSRKIKMLCVFDGILIVIGVQESWEVASKKILFLLFGIPENYGPVWMKLPSLASTGWKHRDPWEEILLSNIFWCKWCWLLLLLLAQCPQNNSLDFDFDDNDLVTVSLNFEPNKISEFNLPIKVWEFSWLFQLFSSCLRMSLKCWIYKRLHKCSLTATRGLEPNQVNEISQPRDVLHLNFHHYPP